jgi:hypothetical protein
MSNNPMNNLARVTLLATAAAVFIAPSTALAGAAICIAAKSTDPTRSDDFYELLLNGTSTGYEAERAAREEIRKRMSPDHNSAPTCRSSRDMRSGHLVLISARTPYLDVGWRTTWAIGFGADLNAARQDAYEEMRRRNWTWVKDQHGYQVVEQVRF